MFRRSRRIGGVLVALAVAAGCGGAKHVSQQPTLIRANITPFTHEGHLRTGLRVSRVARGMCEPGSDSLPNNVYRCFSGNFVLDPCWRDWRAPAPEVVCLEEPWERAVIRLRLASPPQRATGHTDLRGEPWGITLRSGLRCIALQGAHDTLSGKEGSPAIDYYCGKYPKYPHFTLALVRGINRSRALWAIRAARFTHRLAHPYRLVGPVAIRTAWYGGNNPLSHQP